MIDGARDPPDEVKPETWARISFAGPTEKRIRRHFLGVLTNDHTYLSDSQFDEWKLCSLSKPELNAHVERSPSNSAAHVAFIIAIESKVREDGPEWITFQTNIVDVHTEITRLFLFRSLESINPAYKENKEVLSWLRCINN